MSIKVRYEGNSFIVDENGDLELPIESKLFHRFELVDGVVIDKYDGVSDEEVRRIDHEEAMQRNQEAIAEWEAMSDEDKALNPKPLPLPPLDI